MPCVDVKATVFYFLKFWQTRGKKKNTCFGLVDVWPSDVHVCE